jgi:hypothetical protein
MDVCAGSKPRAAHWCSIQKEVEEGRGHKEMFLSVVWLAGNTSNGTASVVKAGSTMIVQQIN